MISRRAVAFTNHAIDRMAERLPEYDLRFLISRIVQEIEAGHPKLDCPVELPDGRVLYAARAKNHPPPPGCTELVTTVYLPPDEEENGV